MFKEINKEIIKNIIKKSVSSKKLASEIAENLVAQGVTAPAFKWGDQVHIVPAGNQEPFYDKVVGEYPKRYVTSKGFTFEEKHIGETVFHTHVVSSNKITCRIVANEDCNDIVILEVIGAISYEEVVKEIERIKSEISLEVFDCTIEDIVKRLPSCWICSLHKITNEIKL